MTSLVRFLYNCAYPLIALLMLPGLIWKMLRRGKYRHKFGQRFAIYSKNVRARLANRPRTWVHAVSVGEVLIALKLIDRLRERDPTRAFVLSTTTSTGFALTTKHRSDWLEPIYNPLDFILFTRRAIALIRPTQLILVEAEVWPNLVAGVRATGATAVLVNARLSPRSESRYRRARWITAPIFNSLDAICVPDPEDIDRWQTLGVRRELLHLTGSIKFDNPPQPPTTDFRPLLEKLGIAADTPILLGASTHSGEERLLGETLRDLRQTEPRWIYLAVPRHVERTPEIERDLESLGLTTARRTQLKGLVTPRLRLPLSSSWTAPVNSATGTASPPSSSSEKASCRRAAKIQPKPSKRAFRFSSAPICKISRFSFATSSVTAGPSRSPRQKPSFPPSATSKLGPENGRTSSAPGKPSSLDTSARLIAPPTSWRSERCLFRVREIRSGPVGSGSSPR